MTFAFTQEQVDELRPIIETAQTAIFFASMVSDHARLLKLVRRTLGNLLRCKDSK